MNDLLEKLDFKKGNGLIPVIVQDAIRIFPAFPQKIPAAFSGVLDIGERSGGDLPRFS